MIVHECPKCGAPLNSDKIEKCNYCGTQFINNNSNTEFQKFDIKDEFNNLIFINNNDMKVENYDEDEDEYEDQYENKNENLALIITISIILITIFYSIKIENYYPIIITSLLFPIFYTLIKFIIRFLRN